MFQDANTANREFLGKERDAELERHGLESTETGTLSVLSDDDWEDARVGGDVFTGGRDGLETETTPTGRIPVQRPGPTRAGTGASRSLRSDVTAEHVGGGAGTGPRTRPVPRTEGSRAPVRSDTSARVEATDEQPHGRHADR
jgi:hypothetical protein